MPPHHWLSPEQPERRGPEVPEGIDPAQREAVRRSYQPMSPEPKPPVYANPRTGQEFQFGVAKPRLPISVWQWFAVVGIGFVAFLGGTLLFGIVAGFLTLEATREAQEQAAGFATLCALIAAIGLAGKARDSMRVKNAQKVSGR